MCGIYGIVNLREPVDADFLKRKRDLLYHRGPDDAGIWISPSRQVGLAHRRLSIIDLTSAGHQPMISQDERCVIVFNGEVYNFQALRAELENFGYQFKGNSDTEVALVSYQAWGNECISRFNGMFALSIYDRGDDNTPPSLFFARDRAGKKPFYYFHEGNRFQFASELKALDTTSSIDISALNYYLALGYIPGELCLAKGVRKLPPAHAARLDMSTLKFQTWRYWNLPVNSANPDTDGEKLADQAESLLMDAVKLRLISDVPVGVLLSGGLDSSLIVAAAARQSEGQVKTFTISLPGTRYDEGTYARCVADYFATEHHVLETRYASMDIINELSSFIDEPIADSSLIPAFMISKLTREKVKVAIGGDGGDELFGGYTHYLTTLTDQHRFAWIPSGLTKTASRIVSYLPSGVKGRNRIASLREGPLQQMIWGSPYFDIALRRRIFTDDQVSSPGFELDAPERWLLNLFKEGCDPVDSMTRTDFGSILPDDFLVKVDRASMANSLEIRSPFLDYRLVEFAFSCIPSRWKVFGGKTRLIQRILAKRMLPSNLSINRKQGFSIPMDDWLRVDKCRIIRNYMSYLPEVIKRNEVESLIRGHMRGRANGARLYALLMLGIAMKNNKW